MKKQHLMVLSVVGMMSFSCAKKEDTAAVVAAVTSGGATVTTFAGTVGTVGQTDGNGTAATFGASLGSMTAGPDGSIYVADKANNCIRKITAAGDVTVYVGSTSGASGTTEGIGTAMRLNSPTAVVADASGILYIADTGNCSIRKVPAGASAISTIFSGVSGTCAANVVGVQATARYNGPNALAIDIQGGLYVADAPSYKVVKIPTILATVGTSVAFSGAGTAGTLDSTGVLSTYGTITGLAVDGNLNVFVADSTNSTIRKISSGATYVTTFAGYPGIPGSTDGLGAQARFNNPTNLSILANGDMYVTDAGNQIIRKITNTGVVTTLAGTVGTVGSTDGVGTAASFKNPYGITAVNGSLFVADRGNYAIRKIVIP